MKALLLPLLALAAMPLAAQTSAPAEGAAHEVHVVQTAGGRIELHQDRGPCQRLARRAAYVPAKGEGETVAGCWVGEGDVVAIVFFDGDIARVPVAALKKVVAV